MKKLATICGFAGFAGLVGVMATTWPHKVVVASYETSLENRTKQQRHNALLAASHLNGAIIKPGAEFSFIHRVGSFGRSDGYRKAPVAYSGKLIRDWGGGVCQVSTTVYNAFLLAGLDILEKHPHEFCPGYAVPGCDAAVAYPGVDLRVRNTLNEPLQVQAQVQGNKLVVRLIGDHSLPSSVVVQPKVENRVQPSQVYLGQGKHARTSTVGAPGCSVTILRKIGNKTETISQDEYPVMPHVVAYD